MHSGRVAYFQESLADPKGHATPLTFIPHLHCQEDFRKNRTGALGAFDLQIFKKQKQIIIILLDVLLCT